MGLRIILLLVVLVVSVLIFLVSQVKTIITVNSRNGPPDPKNFKLYNTTSSLDEYEGDILSFVQVFSLSIFACLLSQQIMLLFSRFLIFTSACLKILKELNNCMTYVVSI